LSSVRLDGIYLFDPHQLIIEVEQIERFMRVVCAIQKDGEEFAERFV
jgi:hypothetical protein